MAHEFHINTLAVALAASMYQRVYGNIITYHLQGCHMSMVEQSVMAYGLRAFLADDNFGFRDPVINMGNRWAATLYVLCLHLAVKATHKPTDAPKALGRYSVNNMLLYLGAPTLHTDDLLGYELAICTVLKWDITPVILPEDAEDERKQPQQWRKVQQPQRPQRRERPKRHPHSPTSVLMELA